MQSIAKNRIQKEMKMFAESPTPGITCTCTEDSVTSLSGGIMGPPGSPFEGGLFQLDIQIPNRYPFEPPSLRFITPVYHPNIDTKGRICLDTLKPPPAGSWKPHLNLSTILMMIRVLMAEPGSEDPLMADIWQEYKYNYPTYSVTAKQWTEKYAKGDNLSWDNIKPPLDLALAPPKTTDASLPTAHPPSAKDHIQDSAAVSQKTDVSVMVPRKRLLGLKTTKKLEDGGENTTKRSKLEQH